MENDFFTEALRFFDDIPEPLGFTDALRQAIANFNSTRGRRRELNPQILSIDEIPRDVRAHKFGKLVAVDLPIDEDVIKAHIKKLAEDSVRTLLKRKPRPKRIFARCTLDGKGAIHTNFINSNQKRLFARIWIPF